MFCARCYLFASLPCIKGEESYAEARLGMQQSFHKAHGQTRRASKAEEYLTSCILGGCLASSCAGGRLLAGATPAHVYKAIPFHVVLCSGAVNMCGTESGCLSSGIIRDYTVIREATEIYKKEFYRASPLLPLYRK